MKKLNPLQKWRFNLRNQKQFSKYLKRQNRSDKNVVNYVINSPLLNFLDKNIFCKEKQFKVREYCHLKIPRIFSFIEDPESTLETLTQLVNAACKPRLSNLLIDHKDCEVLDICASTVMDVILLAARKEWSQKNIPSPLNGIYSRNHRVNEIIKVAGILKHLEHYDSKYLPAEISRNYTTFDLVVGEKENQIKQGMSTYRELVATRLTDYFNNILNKHNVQLNSRGKNKLSQLLTEVLDNTEQHSNTYHWYVIGYREENGVCNICLFNFGNSFYQTLYSANLDKKSKENILKLVEKHTRKGLFQINESWTEESLWTLYALQEGISRFNTDESIIEDTIRGTGTTKLIEFFMQLSQKDDFIYPPKMVLLSGNTYILFNKKYSMVEKEFGGGSRKIIAFNKSNDLNEKPDPENVKTLRYSFPGTLISLKFRLDTKYLENFVGNKK